MSGLITGADGLMYAKPALPVQAMKTYSVYSPQREITCEEADCLHHQNGWITEIDESTELGQMQASYIRSNSGRRFSEQRSEAGLTQFSFAMGQRCFVTHSVPWEGKERFTERSGDWRGNPAGDFYEHTADTWVDSFANHQIKLAERLEQG